LRRRAQPSRRPRSISGSSRLLAALSACRAMSGERRRSS
jgi:hypothetical protein